MKIKKALIFGITGQDGSLLADFLLKKKYKVYGVSRYLGIANLKKLIPEAKAEALKFGIVFK